MARSPCFVAYPLPRLRPRPLPQAGEVTGRERNNTHDSSSEFLTTPGSSGVHRLDWTIHFRANQDRGADLISFALPRQFALPESDLLAYCRGICSAVQVPVFAEYGTVLMDGKDLLVGRGVLSAATCDVRSATLTPDEATWRHAQRLNEQVASIGESYQR